MDTFVTEPLQHEVIVMQKKKVKDCIQNAIINQVYMKYQTNALFFFSVGVPSKSVTQLPIVSYCRKEFQKHLQCSGVIDPLPDK